MEILDIQTVLRQSPFTSPRRRATFYYPCMLSKVRCVSQSLVSWSFRSRMLVTASVTTSRKAEGNFGLTCFMFILAMPFPMMLLEIQPSVTVHGLSLSSTVDQAPTLGISQRGHVRPGILASLQWPAEGQDRCVARNMSASTLRATEVGLKIGFWNRIQKVIHSRL